MHERLKRTTPLYMDSYKKIIVDLPNDRKSSIEARGGY